MLPSSHWLKFSLDRPRHSWLTSVGSSARVLNGLLTAIARVGVLVVFCAAPWWFEGVESDIQFWLSTDLRISLGWRRQLCNRSRLASLPFHCQRFTHQYLPRCCWGSFQVGPTSDPSIGSHAVVVSSDSHQQDQAGPITVLSTRALILMI